MAKTKYAIVGAGAISQGYAQAFLTCDRCEVVGVADVRPEAAESLAEVLGTRAFESYAEMAEEQKPDAVLICTPPSTHPEICLDFIDRGVHVLCEKPFAVSTAGLEESDRGRLGKGRQDHHGLEVPLCRVT